MNITMNITMTETWQPIESAPRDRILWLAHPAYVSGPSGPFLGYYNHERGWWSACGDAGTELTPTHWFPAFPPLPW